MGSDSNVWHQVHAQREDGVAAMFLIRDVQPRADQPKIFVIELPYPVTDLSGQPDAAAYRRLSAFQEQWLEPACAALGWTFVAWKCEDGSFFLYLYGAGDPDALLEKLAPFDGELGFFNDVDADWSEYAALRELVEQAESEDEEGDGEGEHDHVHGDAHDHDHHDHDHHDHDHHDHDHHDHDHHDHDHHEHDHHEHAAHEHDHHEHADQDHHDHDHGRGATALEVPVVELARGDEHAAGAEPAPHRSNGKSHSIAAGSEAAAATHRPLPRAIPARAGRAGQAGSTARAADKRAATATRAPARRPAAKSARRAAPARPAKPATTKPARRAAPARPAKPAAAKPAAAKPAATKPAKRPAAKPAKRAAPPSSRRPAAKPRRSR